MRIPPDPDANAAAADDMFTDSDAPRSPVARCREAILVRKAGEATASSTGRVTSSSTRAASWGSIVGRSLGVGGDENADAEGSPGARSSAESALGSAWVPARLAEGIGVDARKYVDSLLNLNR